MTRLKFAFGIVLLLFLIVLACGCGVLAGNEDNGLEELLTVHAAEFNEILDELSEEYLDAEYFSFYGNMGCSDVACIDRSHDHWRPR